MVPHHQQSVLIVDEQEETREVLRTVFGRRGVQILETNQPEKGLRLAQDCHPDLIVLNLDSQVKITTDMADQFDRESRSHGTPVVLLGTMRSWEHAPRGEFVSKPYHYGSLIRKIEELLEKPSHPQ